MTNLGRLRQVKDLRGTWATEDRDFTPWLAEDENIKILSEAVGIDLEVEATEEPVGPFRADILCRDTARQDNRWVLVENQLERTDHTHLGQLMTYAAGLETASIIWIAKQFREEHRAALDWLNDITSEEFNFFGLEVELWQIGESPIAPKFNVVCKPNDWTRSISGAKRNFESSDLTPGQILNRKFWTKFREVLDERGGVVRPVKPSSSNFQSFSLGKTGVFLSAWVNARDSRLGLNVVFDGEKAKPRFKEVEKQRAPLDQAFGPGLEWRLREEAKQSYISVDYDNANVSDETTWPELQDWLYDQLQKMHSTFSEPAKQLGR